MRPGLSPKGARTRAHVLETAGRAFARASVDDVKVEEIAAAAGVSVGTIYSHFGSKHGLAFACESELLDLLGRDLGELREEPSPIRRVIAAGDAYLAHVARHPICVRLATARALYPGADASKQRPQARELDRRMSSLLMRVASDLKAAMDCGEIRRMPIDEAMVFIWGAWNGVAMMIARGDQLQIPPGTAARALSLGQDLLLSGAGLAQSPGAAAGD